MVGDDISIHYHGFHPSEYTQAHLDAQLRELQDWAPYGSAIKAHISRKNEVLKATLTVFSRGVSFFSKATGTGIRDVSDRLLQQARKKIGRWKTRRFRQKPKWQLQDIDWKRYEGDGSNVA
jgi:hypothetical protein